MLFRSILQMVQHMLAEDMIIKPEDYTALRKVFRQCGGSWEKLASGDQLHLELLKTILTSWGQMDGRQQESDLLV